MDTNTLLRLPGVDGVAERLRIAGARGDSRQKRGGAADDGGCVRKNYPNWTVISIAGWDLLNSRLLKVQDP